MLTERQTDILFQTLGYATGFAFLVTMLLGNTPYYLTGAAVTLVLCAVFAGVSYLSGEGEK